MDIQVIGDELHVDGMVVALLATRNVPATVMGELVDGLQSGTLFEADEIVSTRDIPGGEREHAEREALLAHFNKIARNGLLRLTDVCDTINRHYDGEDL